MNWLEIFPPSFFLEDMLCRGEIETLDMPYEYLVSSLCHNSCAWMIKRVYEQYPNLAPNLYLVTGSIKGSGLFSSLNFDHSWIEYREGNSIVALDLTLKQFRRNVDKLYVGHRLPELNEYVSIPLSDREKVINLLLNL